MDIYNEPIAAAIVGILLSISAGVRITLPLLAINLLVYFHEVRLPASMDWMGTEATLIILCVATVMETLCYFVPVAGTYVRGASTPLAFVAGTLIMSVPLADHNPIYRWTLAAFVGGGLSALTSLGITAGRVFTTPAEVATSGIFTVLWNIGEMIFSVVLIVLGAVILFAGLILGVVSFLAACVILYLCAAQLAQKWRARKTQPAQVLAAS